MTTIKFKIEKDVPLTKYAKSKIDSIGYPVTKMDVGASFPTEELATSKDVAKVRARINTLKRKYHITRRGFSIAEDPKNPGRLRVWRTS